MSSSDLRTLLEAELQDVLAKAERLTSHLRNEDRTLPKDSEDLAQFLENDEVLEALEVRTRDRIEEIRSALARLADGSHGRCATCGGTIQPERLEVLPTTTLCASCAT
jgi:DnaK suppressor protein